MSKQGLIGIIILVSLGLGYLYLNAGRPAWKVANSPNSGREILIVGEAPLNSIDSVETPHSDYVEHLKAISKWSVNDLTRKEFATPDILAHIHTASPKTPDVVVLVVGPGDLGQRIGLPETVTALGEIIQHFHGQKALVAIALLEPEGTGDNWHLAIQSSARQHQALWVDTRGIDGVGDTDLAPRIHAAVQPHLQL